MFHRQRWLITLALALTLASTCFAGSLHASALVVASHNRDAASTPHTRELLARLSISPCGASHFDLYIAYNNWLSTAYFCDEGTIGLRVAGVNEIYDNSGGPLWIKWNDGHKEHYCSISGIGAYKNFSSPATTEITQVNYGSKHSESYCGD